MITFLEGKLVEALPTQVTVAIHGVDYEVLIPLSSYDKLPPPGGTLKLLTHLAVREDAHVLYGFATLEERTAFRQLIRISGVGARTALSVLSGLSVADLAQAVTLQEAGRLTKIPGIGKKTAERLLLELKGKLADAIPAAGSVALAGSEASDILNALLSLGYNEKEAHAAIKGLAPDVAVADGIRAALKALAKS